MFNESNRLRELGEEDCAQMGLSSQAFRGGGKSGDDKAQDVALGACD